MNILPIPYMYIIFSRSKPEARYEPPPPTGGRYTLVLSAPQWAYLSKLEVLHQPGVQVDEQSDGSVTVYLSQEHYSIFLSSISAKKPRVNVSITDITVEVDSGEWSRVPLVAFSRPTHTYPGAEGKLRHFSCFVSVLKLYSVF